MEIGKDQIIIISHSSANFLMCKAVYLALQFCSQLFKLRKIIYLQVERHLSVHYIDSIL
jgi:hypothetical protein